MARKPMVTRTIQSTFCSVLCADTVKAEMLNKEVILPRTYKDENEMLKAVKKVAETDTIKCVAIATYEVRSELYGMDEDAFIASAKILDKETRKELETTPNTDNT